MYKFAHCSTSTMIVHHFTGKDSGDDDYERMIAAWRRFYQEAAESTAVAVVVVAPTHPQPNARWRNRIAEVTRLSRGPTRIAVVTTNPLIRAVITAVNWLAPPGPDQHTSAFATFEDAVRTFESQEGRSLLRLRELYAETQSTAGRTGQASSSAVGL